MASEAMIKITQEDIEWARLLSEEKYFLDNKSKMVTAWREGRQEGREEGLQEGLEKGQEKTKLNIAKSALAEGATPEFVQKITGLDLETIKQLGFASN